MEIRKAPTKRWGLFCTKALPFGEGAPEGGGRGAVQSTILLLPCGEYVLR